MARDLGARTDALVQADRMRRQLLADVSHELNTPVTAIRGYLETLAMPDMPLDEATRARYLGIINDETSRLEGIIGDLLDLARLEGGGGALSIGDVMVEQLFARVVARHERKAQNAGVQIVSEILPGANIVRGDHTRLEQALQNLAANAVRYAPSGSTISLTARPEDAGVTLSVTDAGPGITPEHLDRVFDRFYKIEASRARYDGEGMPEPGGSGLGLSIVKAIAERHGGRVSVTSRPGLTVFSLWVPAS
jgi:signal transduction histidine kinase